MKTKNVKTEGPKSRLCRHLRNMLAVALLLVTGLFVCNPMVQAQAEEAVTTPTITPVEPATDDAGVYQIGTAAELYWFAGLVNGTLGDVEQDMSAKAVLTADIVINEGPILNEDGTLAVEDTSTLITWVPIGNATGISSTNYPTGAYYTGIFDGQGHSISGLYYAAMGNEYTAAGLFGAATGSIKRVQLLDSYIETNGDTGGICGFMRGTITACYNEATVENGICGNLFGGTVGYCYNAGIVGEQESRCGGICGTYGTGAYSGTTTIKYCITETGEVLGYASINSSYGSSADVTGTRVCTSEELASGAMTYLLNGNVRADDLDAAGEAGTIYWYQNLGENGETTPVLMDSAHGKVYVDIACENNKNLLLYTNTHREPQHEYSNGYLCDYCYDINPDKLSELILENVWQIDSAADLYLFSDYYNNYVCYESEGAADTGTPAYADAILLADIDLNEAMAGVDLTTVNTSGALADAEGTEVDTSAWTQWIPIGKNRSYTGTFDGNGKVIYHLFINQPNETYLALIYGNGGNPIVKNLGVRDSFICADSYFGSVLYGAGTVTNCFSNSTIVATSHGTTQNNPIYAAGIAPSATVSNSYFDGIVYRYSSSTSVGGTDVYPVGKTTEDCFSTGVVKSYRYPDVETSFNSGHEGTTIVEAEQVTNGDLAHMLQLLSTEGEKYWSQGANYPVPTAGAKIEHNYDTSTYRCCCGASKWDDNLTDDYFASAPEKNEDGAYELKTVEHLYWFAGLVNGDERVCTDGVSQTQSAKAVLMNDIVVNEGSVLNEAKDGLNVSNDDLIAWIPIGLNSTYAYTGTFDGQGYTISGLVQPYEDVDYAGLFGYATAGTIKNVAITNAYIVGKGCVGGICAYTKGTVTACYSDAVVAGGSSYYGGLCGYVATINNSYYAGTCDQAIAYVYAGTAQYCASTTGLSAGTVKYSIKNLATTPEAAYTSSYKYTLNTENPVASGELAYLLNGKVSAETEGATLYWYQQLGEDSKPTLKASEAGKVYALQACPDVTTLAFSNSTEALDHTYSDGYICGHCYRIIDDADFISEDGTTWQIGDAAGLYAFNKYMNNYLNYGTDRTLTAINVVLTADIDLNPGMDLTLDETTKTLKNTTGLTAWTPIGTSSSKYAGTFDGQGHVIKHLYVTTASDNAGLFGYCATTAEIKNTGLMESYLCYSGTSTSYYVGSFSARYGTVTNCFSTAVLHGYKYICGIVGDSGATNCYFTGQIYGRYDYPYCYSTGGSTNTNCYTTQEIYRSYNSWSSHSDNSNSTVITADQVANGSLAHLLQLATDTETWSQKTDGTESYPVPMGGAEVDHIFVDGTCICGEEYITEFEGYTITLGELIGINFKLTLSDPSGLYVKFTMPDGTISDAVSVGETGSDGYYTVSCYVAAKEMNKDVTATLYDASENILVADTISVAEYANEILEGSTYEEADKDMVTSMLNYGAFAELYFGEATGSTPDEEVLEEAADIVTALSGAVLSKSEATEENAIQYEGCSLILLADTTLRIYFAPSGETTLEQVSFTSDGTTLTKGTYQKGGVTYYYADVTGIKPDALDKDVTVTAVADGVDYEVTLSPMFYVKDMLDGKTEDEALIKLLRALYAYHTQAVSYKQIQ